MLTFNTRQNQRYVGGEKVKKKPQKPITTKTTQERGNAERREKKLCVQTVDKYKFYHFLSAVHMADTMLLHLTLTMILSPFLFLFHRGRVEAQKGWVLFSQ